MPEMRGIEFEIQRDAADWAATMDGEAVRSSNLKYAEMRETWLSLGAFRAFEWLEENGYKVEKR